MPKVTKMEGFDNKLMPEPMHAPRRSPMGKLPWILLLLVIIAGGIFAFHQHREGEKLEQQIKDLKSNPEKINQEETKALLDKVGQLVELPDEQPVVATVSDLAPLKDQPFFARAQIGDKVLIFSQARKAVLYRPTSNKVIEVAPVNLDNPETEVNTDGSAKATKNSSSSTANSNTTNDASNSDEATE